MALAVPQIIGKGTWLDRVASEIIEREKQLGRDTRSLRVESGLGASGIPHLGTYGDGARAFGVKMALTVEGIQGEYIAFSDDKDGLRKVPAGLAKSLQKYLGFPVSNVPDPFDCHESYGQHMSLLLLDALDKTRITYRAVFASEAYKQGVFNTQIEKILQNSERVGEIIQETLGQEKYTEVLPYFPVCSSCGRISTTRALDYDSATHSVTYACEGIELRGGNLEGCGYDGEVDVRSGNGKLSWKVEFAARWSALRINYEAYGKDLIESVKANDRVMEEILGEPAPYHTRYEHFIDKTGAKLSKSTGNVIAPQLWLRYGSPETLLLLMYKRSVGSRPVWLRDIPTYIAEVDELEDVYFGKKKVTDMKELARLTGLYEYCWTLQPPEKPSLHVPHNLLVYLAKVAPKGREREFVLEKLAGYGYKPAIDDKQFEERLERAFNWAREVETFTAPDVKVEGAERDAVLELAGIVNASSDETYLQNAVFSLAKKHGLEPGRLFKTLYRILIGSESGPRLGPYIIAMGQENVASALVKSAKTSGGS
ncbi:lysine--tRNA ligase [Candidatus Bathyarchaeota archaeon]|nr:MAG: lysine--tRNA ligase [Candidatus Bathyarchaeota archaeon]TMI29756.1 MAG: lysine--tRNA ligase [Candidatus Bathyarchaeota archaeon]